MNARTMLVSEHPTATLVDQVDHLTLRQAAMMLDSYDEFLDRVIRRFHKIGIEDCEDTEIAVWALLDSRLCDSSYHRSFRIQDLVIRLRTRLYENDDVLTTIREFCE